MSDTNIPFDPDFDAPTSAPSGDGHPKIHFVFGVIAGITAAAAIGILVLLL